MRLIIGICLTAITLLVACEKKSENIESEAPCTRGEEGCDCKKKRRCNEGLVCASGLCIDLSTIDSDSSSLPNDDESESTETEDSKKPSEDTDSNDVEDLDDSASSNDSNDSEGETGEAGTDHADSASGSEAASTDDTEDDDSSGDTETPASDTASTGGEVDSQGESSTDALDTENICERIGIEAGVIPNRVVIVQDLSSSLHSSGRWDPMKAAMIRLVEQYDSGLALGAVPFPTTLLDGTTSDADCTVNEQYLIPPALGSGEQIINLIYTIESADLIGGTPTYDGLMKARSMLVDHDPNDGSERYIILVTDGLPNCYDNNGAGSAEPQDIDRVTETIEAIRSEDITVFVVGYDMGAMALDTLNQWAALGGTQSAYAADDTTSLLEQMSAISGGLISCSYTLEQPVADPKFVRVRIDGESIPFAESNGWSLSEDDTTISLEGTSCDLLQDGGIHTIDVAVECTIVVI